MCVIALLSICALQGIRCDSMPSLAATSWSCRFGFEELEKTPRTLVCDPSFRGRDIFRMTASAPYIPPLLMMCRIFTCQQLPSCRFLSLCDLEEPKFFRIAGLPAATSRLPSFDIAAPGRIEDCCRVEEAL